MKKIISILIILTLSITCFVGCSKDNGGDVLEELVIYGPNRPLEDVTDIKTWMEEELGFKLKYITVSGSEYDSKLNLLISSGEVPDIMVLNETTYYDYVEQGLLLDLEDVIRKHAPKIFDWRTEEQFNALRYHKDGKLYAIANTINPGYGVNVCRKDWLDNLGLKEPETLEEYKEVIRAFTFDDPDGNGIDDTYGLGGSGGFENVFSAFFPAFGANPSQWILRNGKIVLGTTQPEMIEALTFLHDLYKEGCIDPEYLTMDADGKKNKILSGKWGMWQDQLWYADPENSMYKGIGELTCLKPPMNEDGEGGYISGSSNWASQYTVISATCKSPEKAAKLINFLATEENYKRIRGGIEGVHYKRLPDGKKESIGIYKEDPTAITRYGIAPTYTMPFMPYDPVDVIGPSLSWLEMRREYEKDYYAAMYVTSPEIAKNMLGVGYRDYFKKYCNKMIIENVDIEATFNEMVEGLYNDYDLGEIEKLQTEFYKDIQKAIKK